MSDSLSQEEINLAYENAAKRRLIDDKDLDQNVVDMIQQNSMIPEELINEFKFPKEMEKQNDQTEIL